MSVALLVPTHEWYCTRCPVKAVSHEARPHVRFHACAAMRGLNAPMLRVGARAKVDVIERGDYIGREHVTLDANGRPVQSVVVERDDGIDTTVYAPAATATSDL